ncbi:circularly permuted type 2 ATP-grasp protein [Rhodocista pekingensis]|uniref:Circularly permuted type 2 ATP-grasp protein n=1 Tax=Rhodocista pekingensis TaxID=201185 RepID=A0ABW2KPG5_9PROT
MADPAAMPPQVAVSRPEAQPSLFGEADALGYEGCGPVWDEMVTGTGRLRPHWQGFFSAHGPFAPEVMGQRWEAARRLLFQNGVTYNLYGDGGDAQGHERPWPLDPIPLLLPAEEWRAIAAGVVQRARLLEAVLADHYGGQSLVRDGIIPAALLHADPGFLRACHGVEPPGGVRLALYAADLVRGGDGVWRVLASRTQSPTGAGYALENRVILSQTLPDAFRACNVDRLAPFFEALRDTLVQIAPRASGPDGTPRAVLLTPGPLNEAYFEHAYLARHLGLTLAEGADLTVRDQAVYLKTLSGLERVDVILRRVDDGFCDPLELRADSALGVPGLLEAVRAGSVAVANALGSGLTDSPALIPWMPALCRHLLGEDLSLPDVPTLWAGEPGQRREMLETLERLSLRPAFSALPGRPVLGSELDRTRRAALAGRIDACPVRWVGQAIAPPSTVPVWRDGKVEAQPLVLRVFACATGADWTVMRGGLVRISADPRHPSVSLQEGAGAKDAWVVGSGPDTGGRRRNQVPEAGQREPAPVSGSLPSRAADHLFWLGRYAERADARVRVLRAAAARLVDEDRPGATEELLPLLRLMGWIGLVPTAIAALPPADSARGIRQSIEIAFDPANPGGLRAALDRLRRAAVGVRDRLPPELSRVLAQLDTLTADAPGGGLAAAMLRLDDLATAMAALAGLEQDGMVRSPGWRFLVLGRRLERAIGIAAGLRGTGLLTGSTAPHPALAVLLELAASGGEYRARFPAGLRVAPALSLLLAESDHPRSLLYQLDAVAAQLVSLPRAETEQEGRPPVETALGLLHDLLFQAMREDAGRDPAVLLHLVERLDTALPQISDLISQAYFSHAFARAT